ncbi:hypothetical protein BsWGS_15624 [Bradybaena similaris]
MSNKGDKPSNRGTAERSTHDPRNEPATLETIFVQPATGSSRKEKEHRREAGERSQFPPGDAADDASTASLRPRPLHDPRGLILAAPQYPFPVAPGYIPFSPPFPAVTEKAWADSYIPYSYRNPYHRLEPLSIKYFVIIMALFFLAALVVAMFMAIYFGHKYSV